MKKKKFVLAIDQGTTSSRAILFDANDNLVSLDRHEVKTMYPKPGWVESDPKEIWLSVVDSINGALANENITIDDVDSIGITNQRETTIVWDKKTGVPVYNAIIWQSKQTQELVNQRLKYDDIVKRKTGLKMDAYFSASKIRFILDHIPNGQKRAEKGELLFGTVETWLIYKLTNGKNHYTDITNASRTLLFNINTRKWDPELLKIWNIPAAMLPKVCPTGYDFGEATFFKSKTHIYGCIGDQQSALFGQCCFNKGELKNTYGTGCFTLLNVGDKPVYSKNGLVSTIAWQIGDKVTYALEASVFMGGAIIQWLRDGAHLIRVAPESEKCALAVQDNLGVYLVPAFVGLGTPYWDNEVRASFFGITRGTKREHLVRAGLEAIAYQIYDCLDTMKKDAKITIKSLSVDGGASMNNFLMQFQSDILNTQVKLPKCIETTALGAAYMAGLKSGFYKDLKQISAKHKYQKTYKPNLDKKKVEELIKCWHLAVESAMHYKPIL